MESALWVTADSASRRACGSSSAGLASILACANVWNVATWGDLPAPAQFRRRQAREPVVRVDKVVGRSVALLEGGQAVEELRDVPVQALLGLTVGPGLEVNDPGVLTQLDDFGVVRVVDPGIYVCPVAPPAELPRYLQQIDVHPAGIALAQPGERAPVDAQ